MQIFTNFCNVLTAASQYFKQLHLCADQGGYSLHLLTNKIYNDLDEANDRLKELSISVSSNKKITIALNSLEAAANFCRQIPDSTDTQNIQLMINNCTLILEDLGVLVERASAEVSAQEIIFKQGLLNALGDISEKLAKDKYLLNMELSPLSAQAQDEFDESKVNRNDLGRFSEKVQSKEEKHKEKAKRIKEKYSKFLKDILEIVSPDVRKKMEAVKIDLSKDNILPAINEEDAKDLGVKAMPVILKANIGSRQASKHNEANDISNEIIALSLYAPDIKFPGKTPGYFHFVKKMDDEVNSLLLLDLKEEDGKYAIVHYFNTDNRNLERTKRNSIKEVDTEGR